MSDDEWVTCVRCGEPKRNHMFGYCEGGDAKFVGYRELMDEITELKRKLAKHETLRS